LNNLHRQQVKTTWFSQGWTVRTRKGARQCSSPGGGVVFSLSPARISIKYGTVFAGFPWLYCLWYILCLTGPVGSNTFRHFLHKFSEYQLDNITKNTRNLSQQLGRTFGLFFSAVFFFFWAKDLQKKRRHSFLKKEYPVTYFLFLKRIRLKGDRTLFSKAVAAVTFMCTGYVFTVPLK
jgi:hypothetical protein